MADQSLILKGVALDFVFKLWKSDGTILPNPGGLAARISTSGSTGGAASTNAPTCLDTTGGGCRLQLTTSESFTVFTMGIKYNDCAVINGN